MYQKSQAECHNQSNRPNYQQERQNDTQARHTSGVNNKYSINTAAASNFPGSKYLRRVKLNGTTHASARFPALLQRVKLKRKTIAVDSVGPVLVLVLGSIRSMPFVFQAVEEGKIGTCLIYAGRIPEPFTILAGSYLDPLSAFWDSETNLQESLRPICLQTVQHIPQANRIPAVKVSSMIRPELNTEVQGYTITSTQGPA
ncbi:hypothetical protein C8R44DRAFT_751506 [Mycena epipterygia]|nr:hypothetical protein C8R44DRAFT_751506 [Mycena epipterygia]